MLYFAPVLAQVNCFSLMIKRILFFLIITSTAFCLISKQLAAQVTVNADPRIAALIEAYKQQKKRNASNVQGFRIQLLQETKREAIKTEKARFTKFYPDMPIYESYEAPYFRLRVGDYSNHLQAQAQFDAIKKQFKSAFIVPDKVNAPDDGF